MKYFVFNYKAKNIDNNNVDNNVKNKNKIKYKQIYNYIII